MRGRHVGGERGGWGAEATPLRVVHLQLRLSQGDARRLELRGVLGDGRLLRAPRLERRERRLGLAEPQPQRAALSLRV